MDDVSPTAAVQPAEPTEEQRAQLEALLAARPYGDQDENGIDMIAKIFTQVPFCNNSHALL